MSKRVEKPKAKPVAAKGGAARKHPPRHASPPPGTDPHDPLQKLLRGTYAQRLASRG